MGELGGYLQLPFSKIFGTPLSRWELALVRYITENDEETIYESPSGARLVLIVDGREGQAFPLRGTVHLGRDKTNSVVVADQKVSRHHAMLTPVGNTYVLTDQGSANGTYLNGVLISQPTRLKAQDKIGLGDTLFMFTPEAADPSITEFDQLPPPLVNPVVTPAAAPNSGKTILPGIQNRSIWTVVGCMALLIFALLLTLAVVLGLLLGRGAAAFVLLFWLL
jgi:pSer/pThr/pTyr-binding forkhead associated (FHA) protein